MESIQSKLPAAALTSYIGVFKEPRGLIRVLQFIFAIFAFATACSGSSSVVLQRGADANAVSTSWSYPYNLKNTPISTFNGSSPTISNSNDVKPSAEFFVFTGVTSMLLSLAFIIVYILLDRQYRNDQRFPLVDFIITVIWAILWIAGSSAWAQGVSNIRSQTKSEKIAERSGVCTTQSPCTQASPGSYASIIVSVIFGYLNFILWAGCAWFVYKETKFFKGRTAQQQQQQGPSNSFSDIGSPNMQQQPYSRGSDTMG